MIDNNYTTEEKIYIPTNYINQNYNYRINGDNIVIYTNNNCRTQYNTTYCDCYTYNYENNIVSEVYECSNSSNNQQQIAFSKITDDMNYSSKIREDYYQQSSIYAGMFIIGIIFAILITKERKALK